MEVMAARFWQDNAAFYHVSAASTIGRVGAGGDSLKGRSAGISVGGELNEDIAMRRHNQRLGNRAHSGRPSAPKTKSRYRSSLSPGNTPPRAA